MRLKNKGDIVAATRYRNNLNESSVTAEALSSDTPSKSLLLNENAHTMSHEVRRMGKNSTATHSTNASGAAAYYKKHYMKLIPQPEGVRQY
jgi:hypothetical protein